MRDPIVAIATPYGESAVGMIRLSGKGVHEIVKKLFKTKAKFEERKALYGTLTDLEGKPVDEGIAIFYKAPKSYTGEDMVEITLHGNPVILEKALKIFIDAGCRLAEPGEFTKRAFLNQKLDLTQAEAVADLISAKTDLAREVALRQLRGELSKIIKPLREKLLELHAYLEADIEFSEEDIPTITKDQVLEVIDEVIAKVKELLKTSTAGRVIREGLKLAIVGKPNVGKSSLFNALLGQERAIVTDIAGTTRDFIEETLNLKGVPVRIVDTAGIRKTDDPVEKIGVQRSKEKIQSADVILFVVDGSGEFTEEDEEVFREVKDKDPLVVINKVDLGVKIPLEIFEGLSIIKVSARTGYGLKALEEEILKRVGFVSQEGLKIYVSVRHEKLLKEALEVLERFRERYSVEDISPEIAMLDVREASDLLGEIIGEVTTEEVLGNIFSRFCIGK